MEAAARRGRRIRGREVTVPFEFGSTREGRRPQRASSCVPKGRGLRETVRNPGGGRGRSGKACFVFWPVLEKEIERKGKVLLFELQLRKVALSCLAEVL